MLANSCVSHRSWLMRFPRHDNVIQLGNTVELLLSGHPRGNGNWPLNRGWPVNGWPLNRGSTVICNKRAKS